MGRILEQISETEKLHERLEKKIYKLLSMLPDENYKQIYKGKIN